MDPALWTAVDQYLVEKLIPPDPMLEAALDANRAAGLPEIDVTPNQGKLLNLLARIHDARHILEIGTLGGYSTIWLARALPEDGRLVSLELERRHADVARKNLDLAGVGSKVEIVVGSATETLKGLHGPFDLAFVDADKPSNPTYWQECLRLVRKGGVIVVDNVIRNGGVVETPEDPGCRGVRAMMELIAHEERVEATAIGTVGTKGYDGFLVALVVR